MLRPHRALRYVGYVCFVRYVRYFRCPSGHNGCDSYETRHLHKMMAAGRLPWESDDSDNKNVSECSATMYIPSSSEFNLHKSCNYTLSRAVKSDRRKDISASYFQGFLFLAASPLLVFLLSIACLWQSCNFFHSHLSTSTARKIALRITYTWPTLI